MQRTTFKVQGGRKTPYLPFSEGLYKAWMLFFGGLLMSSQETFAVNFPVIWKNKRRCPSNQSPKLCTNHPSGPVSGLGPAAEMARQTLQYLYTHKLAIDSTWVNMQPPSRSYQNQMGPGDSVQITGKLKSFSHEVKYPLPRVEDCLDQLKGACACALLQNRPQITILADQDPPSEHPQDSLPDPVLPP